MKRMLFIASAAALAMCHQVPALAQTVAGCGTTAIPKADANSVTKLSTQIACFTKAGAAASKAVADRQSRLKAITAIQAPVPTPTPTPKPTPTPTPVTSPPVTVTPAGPRFAVGINVPPSIYYNSERTFVNLAEVAGPWKDSTAGWGATAAAKLGGNGFPIAAAVLAYLHRLQGCS